MWMLYGANGYTGELIAREAVRRGHRPILAGRNPAKIEALARELGCEWRAFDLDDAAKQLDGILAVLHCAGPFSHTSRPMVRACLDVGACYLDITGELAVFESIMRLDEEAKRRGVALIPGVGFDVVPTDCLAAMLAHRLPDADELLLAFCPKGTTVSRGTAKTMLEGIGEGGAIRRDGRIVRVPVAFDAREIPFACGTRTSMTIPWGDVSTAFHSTGIPNIRVYTATPPKTVKRLRFARRLLPILSFRPLNRLLQKIADRRPGPSAEMRTSGRMYLWGRASNRAGEEVSMTMTTPEGYAFTVLSACNAVERLLASDVRAGSWTPSRYFGESFVLSVPGITVDPEKRR
jgi:short subunit dehydrogenase-like uncharacterized protein